MRNEILDHPNCGLEKSDQLLLKDWAGQLDAAGTFPKAAFDLIARNRHFHLFVPKDRGGLDYPLVRGMHIIEAYAAIEGNLGWIVQIGAGGGIFAAYLEETVANQFLGSSNQVIAGSDFVGGEATPVAGGFRVTGAWNYASGACHATAFTGNCRIASGPLEGQIRAVIVPAEAVEVSPSWNGMGMRATDSHPFRISDVFVPESHLFSVDPAHLLVQNRTTSLPFLLFARALFLPVLTGIAGDFLDLCRTYLHQRPESRDDLFAESCNQLDAKLRNSRKKLFRLAEQIWSSRVVSQASALKEENDQFRDLCLQITGDLMKAIDRCHGHTGMKGIRLDEPINIAYRNAKTVAAHHLLRPDYRPGLILN